MLKQELLKMLRDLKPENILLDSTHKFIKITDFGVATVFRTQWEKAPHLVHGIAGSAPYIAPEEWKQDQDYLPTKVDIWACGKFDVLNQY
jgi:protein-serine/threonine kinase